MLPVLAVKFADRGAAAGTAAWLKLSHPGGKINPPTQSAPRSIEKKICTKSRECVQAELDLHPVFSSHI